jgi:hypothetical protein
MDRLISTELVSRLRTLGDVLRGEILGQDGPIGEIVALLQRSLCGLRFPDRPDCFNAFAWTDRRGKDRVSNLVHPPSFSITSQALAAGHERVHEPKRAECTGGRSRWRERTIRSLPRSFSGIRYPAF